MTDRARRRANSATSASEITGWALVILGAVLAIAAGRQVAGLFESHNTWTETTARVTRTRLSGADSSSRASQVRVYQELVYFVKGNRYQESMEVGRFSSVELAREYVANSERPGSETVVWVDSRNPSNVKSKPVERTASAWSVAIFALLGLFSVQAGSSLISASVKKAGASDRAGMGAQAVASH